MQFVSKWKTKGPAAKIPGKESFRLRSTDIAVNKTLQIHPFSVSSDKIGSSAHEWASICNESMRRQIDVLGRPNKSGSQPMNLSKPRIIEVYPAETVAALKEFKEIGDRKWTVSKIGSRKKLLAELSRIFKIPHSSLEQLVCEDDKDSHCTDAFIAALTALIYCNAVMDDEDNNHKSKKNTDSPLERLSICRPRKNEEQVARNEGWIFFPVRY